MPDSIPDDVLDLMAEKFRLLGDSTRLSIVRALMTGGEQNVGDIVRATGRTQTNVSKHLKQMTGAGLLGRRRRGCRSSTGLRTRWSRSSANSYATRSSKT